MDMILPITLAHHVGTSPQQSYRCGMGKLKLTCIGKRRQRRAGRLPIPLASCDWHHKFDASSVTDEQMAEKSPIICKTLTVIRVLGRVDVIAEDIGIHAQRRQLRVESKVNHLLLWRNIHKDERARTGSCSSQGIVRMVLVTTHTSVQVNNCADSEVETDMPTAADITRGAGREFLTDAPLSVEVRTDWHTVGAGQAAKPTTQNPALLAPAVQLIGRWITIKRQC